MCANSITNNSNKTPIPAQINKIAFSVSILFASGESDKWMYFWFILGINLPNSTLFYPVMYQNTYVIHGHK